MQRRTLAVQPCIYNTLAAIQAQGSTPVGDCLPLHTGALRPASTVRSHTTTVISQSCMHDAAQMAPTEPPGNRRIARDLQHNSIIQDLRT